MPVTLGGGGQWSGNYWGRSGPLTGKEPKPGGDEPGTGTDPVCSRSDPECGHLQSEHTPDCAECTCEEFVP